MIMKVVMQIVAVAEKSWYHYPHGKRHYSCRLQPRCSSVTPTPLFPSSGQLCHSRAVCPCVGSESAADPSPPDTDFPHSVMWNINYHSSIEISLTCGLLFLRVMQVTKAVMSRIKRTVARIIIILILVLSWRWLETIRSVLTWPSPVRDGISFVIKCLLRWRFSIPGLWRVFSRVFSGLTANQWHRPDRGPPKSIFFSVNHLKF